MTSLSVTLLYSTVQATFDTGEAVGSQVRYLPVSDLSTFRTRRATPSPTYGRLSARCGPALGNLS